MILRLHAAALAYLALAVAVSAPALAQTNTAEIAGLVRDSVGGVLPGVAITARHPDTGFSVERVTDAEGRFFLPALRVGTWEIEPCKDATFRQLERCGLTVMPGATTISTPQDFDWDYPATGGALYGQASHGWMAAFRRPGARSRIPGLYLAGGSVHTGPGVPMAALSGRLAAQALTQDLASTSRSRRMAMPGGMSTH
jgi:hypothetical protein